MYQQFMAFIFTEYVRCIVISSKIFYNRNMKIISDESEKKKIMVRMNFCDGWRCYQTGNKEATFDVTLPHDAMLLDSRSECSPGGENTGWYDAMDYTYEKTFFVPAKMQGQKVYLEFEGVYHKASVYVNDKKIAYQHNGYIGFYVDLTDHLCYDAENVIRVEAVNSDQPNSRWYSGTGIYRPVWLYVLPREHILPDGIRVTALDYVDPGIRVEADTTNPGELEIEILDEDGNVLQTHRTRTDGRYSGELKLPGAKCWSPKHPVLYRCRVSFGEDVQEIRFGIRVITCTPQEEFCINGERIILRGACIHHDNGLLGACAYEFAERRKVRLLKENGYNAIRSAHNPCSKAMLDACDESGMLVMDEYTDMWYIHKNQYDYATEVMDHYREDLRAIVAKDYNHPSVVMYSTGNEVAESGQKKGIRLCGNMTKWLHKLDHTRPVTCGINIFFNFLSSMGMGVYSDKKAEQTVSHDGKKKRKKAVGSEFYNNLAGALGAGFMKFGATLYPCDLKTKDAFANMDVAGYNYGINRYRHDMKKYPERVIVGSETFCADAYRFWETAKKNPQIIGDFVWAGLDYLGEVGIGSWEYSDYAPDFTHGPGWVTAGSGRIDLTGKPLPEMKYTQVAFEQAQIGIGVVPVNHTKDRHSPSAWKMSNAVESWSWEGCEGKEAVVEVYARADHVELYVNGSLAGSEKPEKDCKVTFHTKYHAGELKAAAYDAQNRMIAETSLKSAGEETILTLEPEQSAVPAEDGLCYVRMKYTDAEGIVKPLARGEIHVSVKGGTLLGAGSACPYYTKSYRSDTVDTYFGEAMAVIRPDGKGTVEVYAQSPYGSAEAQIEAV